MAWGRHSARHLLPRLGSATADSAVADVERLVSCDSAVDGVRCSCGFGRFIFWRRVAGAVPPLLVSAVRLWRAICRLKERLLHSTALLEMDRNRALNTEWKRFTPDPLTSSLSSSADSSLGVLTDVHMMFDLFLLLLLLYVAIADPLVAVRLHSPPQHTHARTHHRSSRAIAHTATRMCMNAH